MATVTWTGGAGDNNWNTGGNWSGGSAPSATDDVIFNTGASSVTTGPSSALAYATVTVTPGYSGSWGTAANTLLFGNITGSVTIAGSGSSYKFGTGTCPVVNIEVESRTFVAITAGTITTLTTSGSQGIELTAAATTCRNVNAVLTAQSGTAFTTLSNGGVVRCYRNVTTLDNYGGAQVTMYNATTMGTVNNHAGASYNHQSTGTITTANNFPKAMISARGATGTFTLTTLNDWAGSMADLVVAGVTITPGTRNYIGRSLSGPTSFVVS
jgi:hypothetical protein